MTHNTLEREACQVLIRFERDGESVGTGFLCIPGHVLTCVHVISKRRPDGKVFIAFPFTADDRVVEAEVIKQWDDPVDVAVLRLCEEPPPGVRPPRVLMASGRLFLARFHAYGYPERHPGGIWAHGVIVARPMNGRLQLGGPFGPPVQPGFSGAPIWSVWRRGVVAMVTHFDADNLRTAYGTTVKEICRRWPELRNWVGWNPRWRLCRWRQRHRGLAGFIAGVLAVAAVAAVIALVLLLLRLWGSEPPPPPPVEAPGVQLSLGARTPRGEPDWPSEVWARPGERIEFNAFYSGARASATDHARLTVQLSEAEGLRHVPGSTIRFPDDPPDDLPAGEPLSDSLLLEKWATPDPRFPRLLADDPLEEGVIRFAMHVVAEESCISRALAVTLQVQEPPREAVAVVHVACDSTVKSPDVLLETAVRNGSLRESEWLGLVRPNVDQVVEGQVFFMNRTDEVLRDVRLRLIFPNSVEFHQPVGAELTLGGREPKTAVPAAIILPVARSTVERNGRLELSKGKHPPETFDQDLEVVPLGDIQPGEAGYLKLRVTVLGDR